MEDIMEDKTIACLELDEEFIEHVLNNHHTGQDRQEKLIKSQTLIHEQVQKIDKMQIQYEVVNLNSTVTKNVTKVLML